MILTGGIIMKFCVYCGAQLEDNATCTCQGAQLAANQQAQQAPPQTPYDQPANGQNPYTPPQTPYAPVNSASQPGKKMIKVTGILMTIFGSFAFIMTMMTLAAVETLFGYAAGGSVTGVLVFELLMAGAMLAFGIVGIVSAKDPAKGMMIVVFGIILIVARVIDFGWAMAVYNDMGVADQLGASLVSGVIGGCVLPILYMVGGNIRRKSDQ
jgi:hypothetical protein